MIRSVELHWHTARYILSSLGTGFIQMPLLKKTLPFHPYAISLPYWPEWGKGNQTKPHHPTIHITQGMEHPVPSCLCSQIWKLRRIFPFLLWVQKPRPQLKWKYGTVYFCLTSRFYRSHQTLLNYLRKTVISEPTDCKTNSFIKEWMCFTAEKLMSDLDF